MEVVNEEQSKYFVQVDNWPAWGMVAVPICGLIIEVYIGVWLEWWIYFGVNTALCITDISLLKRKNLKAPNVFLLLLTPVYLWCRAITLKTSKNYVVSWFLSFFIAVTASYHFMTKEELVKTACPLVTQIANEQLFMTNVSCKVIVIDESIKGGFHQARAIMSNGETLKVVIEEKDNNMIYVTIPRQ